LVYYYHHITTYYSNCSLANHILTKDNEFTNTTMKLSTIFIALALACSADAFSPRT
jgi:hypothetical protein